MKTVRYHQQNTHSRSQAAALACQSVTVVSCVSNYLQSLITDRAANEPQSAAHQGRQRRGGNEEMTGGGGEERREESACIVGHNVDLAAQF